MSSPADLPDWTQAVSGLVSTQLASRPSIITTFSQDVSRFQSIIIEYVQVSLVTPFAPLYEFQSVGGSEIDAGVLSCANVNALCGFTLPVIGPIFALAFNGGSSGIEADIYGVNRVLGKRLLGDGFPQQQFGVTVANATAANTVTSLTGTSPVQLAADCSAINGDAQIVWTIGNLAGATTWTLFMQVADYNGAVGNIQVNAQTAAGTFIFDIGHPWAFIKWAVRNSTATTAASTHTLNIMPRQPVG